MPNDTESDPNDTELDTDDIVSEVNNVELDPCHYCGSTGCPVCLYPRSMLHCALLLISLREAVVLPPLINGEAHARKQRPRRSRAAEAG